MKTVDDFDRKRKEGNELMAACDGFFREFGRLDDAVYADGAIPKKYKELAGLSISVAMRCEECIRYHIQGCAAEKATKQEIVEAIKIGVIGGGSITYPSARFAFGILNKLGIIA